MKSREMTQLHCGILFGVVLGAFLVIATQIVLNWTR